MVGKLLGHYQIVSELGRGGMGIVYKATDTKLNRAVALKVLPAAALASEDDRTRFFREAQAAAQLHHPNIATVFQIDEAVPVDETGAEIDASDGPRPFIAMEFIEGETLQDIIKQGPMKLPEAVRIAAQIAEALRAAHAKEIVHRDIKSANVMLTPEGIAKVLDFGLAKTNQSTMLTRMGSTLGTVAYMSPEQARGQDVDGRSDLYSLGTVLYEMIAGQLPFGGEYEQAVVYGILNESPEALTAIRTGVPMGLEWIVNKLMAKEPRHRYQTAADLVADLETVDLSGSGMSRRSMPAASAAAMAGHPGPADRSGLNVPVWGWAVAAVIVFAALAIGWILHTPPAPVRQPAVHFSVELPQEETLAFLDHRSVAISPDGRTVAYLTVDGLYLMHLSETTESRFLDNAVSPAVPFFSPNSEWLGYHNSRDGQLMKIPVAGGAAVPVADIPGAFADASWEDDGYIYAALGPDGMGRIPDRGGTIEYISAVGEDSVVFAYSSVDLLPDRRAIVYTAWKGSGNSEIRILDLNSREYQVLYPGGVSPNYLESVDKLIFYSNGSLFELPFDVAKRSVQGGPIPLLEDVSNAFLSQGGQFAVSDNGTLVKLPGSANTVSAQSRLEWYRSDGSREVLSPNLRGYWVPRFSAAGDRIATMITGDESSVVLVDASRGTPVELASTNGMPIWSPDGQKVAYADNEARVMLIRNASNPTDVDTLTEYRYTRNLTDWSKDGRTILYFEDVSGNAESNIGYIDVETHEENEFLYTDIDTDFARFSPDGHWVAYETRRDGFEQVYLRRFPGGENLTRVSIDGGAYPVWRPDGGAIYYVTPDPERNIAAVDVDLDNLTVGAPTIVYDGQVGGAFGSFDIHPTDGRLLILTPETTTKEVIDPLIGRRRLDFVINWTTELVER